MLILWLEQPQENEGARERGGGKGNEGMQKEISREKIEKTL